MDSVKHSHQKLVDKGFCCKVSTLSPITQKLIAEAEPKHHMVWNVVWNETSTSTPVRMVFNASCSTGKGYGSLNDLLVKGSAELKSLLVYSIQWRTGLFAMTGDVEKCYNMLSLKEIWYPFQLYLWKDELNTSSPTDLYLMKTAIYGVICVASQCESAFKQLGNILLMDPDTTDVGVLLQRFRYVDNIRKSSQSLEYLRDLSARTEDVLKKMVNVSIKGWTFSGTDPPEKLASEHDTKAVFETGLKWFTLLDLVQVPIPRPSLSKKVRGRTVGSSWDGNTSLAEFLYASSPGDMQQ